MTQSVREIFLYLADAVFLFSYLAIFYKIRKEQSSKSHTLATPIAALIGILFFALSMAGQPSACGQFVSMVGGVVLNIVWIAFILYYHE